MYERSSDCTRFSSKVFKFFNPNIEARIEDEDVLYSYLEDPNDDIRIQSSKYFKDSEFSNNYKKNDLWKGSLKYKTMLGDFNSHVLGPLWGLRLLSTDTSLILPSWEYIFFFITSYDVLHCWALPSAGIKVDACPGRISSVKIIFEEEGYYYGQCSELCGFLHGFMPISVNIV